MSGIDLVELRKLVDRLRVPGSGALWGPPITVVAADAIETLLDAADERDVLAAENARLREALEPSGATKAVYHGEFSFNIFDGVNDDGDDQQRRAYVPWTTVKEIMAAIRARAALSTPTKEQSA